MTDDGFEFVFRSCESLQVLDLSFSELVGDKSLQVWVCVEGEEGGVGGSALYRLPITLTHTHIYIQIHAHTHTTEYDC